MSDSIKFSSKMNAEVLKELRNFAKENNLEISSLLTEAVEDLLLKKRSRPAFKEASDFAFEQFDEALKELAK
ncbi:MAG: hypothetical protein EP319_05015 [Deltaproteobacteria bacterium]|nr:MAG: hypothetical protein EP319_05015 [Deltaproteobacteria bacterium]